MKAIFTLFLLLSIPYCLAAQAPTDTLRYVVLTNGQLSGKAWLLPQGHDVTGFLTYNDRGRGPKLTTHYTLNDQHIPLTLNVSGNDYYKNEVHETFRLADGVAHWKNADEKKDIPITKPAVYVSNVSGMDAMLTQALFAAPNHTVNLLPTGQSVMTQILTHSLKNGQPVTLWAIRGINYTPTLTWLDSKGYPLGSIGDFFVTIREGLEADIPELRRLQKAEDGKFYRQLARTLPEPIPQGLVVQNVNLFDAEKAQLVPAQTIVVKNGRIEQVGSAASVKIPAGYRLINGAGKTVLPGLWDMHVHFTNPTDGIIEVALGITEVRDMGNTDALLTLRNQIDSMQLIAPRIAVMSGFIDGKGPFSGPGLRVTSVEEGIQAVRDYKAKGYQSIKLYSSIKPEWVAPMAAEAHRLGMHVIGHIPSYMTAEQAIAAGYDEITHANMVMLNFLGDTLDTRSMGRFTNVAQRAAGLDLSGPAFARFVQLMQQKHIAFDPTASVFEQMFTSESGQFDPTMASVANRLPGPVQRTLYGQGLPVPMGMAATYKKSFATLLDAIKRLHDAGILMVAGTDNYAGYALHRELELYVQAGISAAQALQMATYNPAKLSNRLGDLGTLTPGKRADFILVNGNPTQRISDIRRVDYTIKDGVLYDSKKLLNSLSIHHYSEP
ncbi:amidohydrolase family protein [Spirosoma arboris]|nr:amidohydrolase family protein [Spirosoma arboris]